MTSLTTHLQLKAAFLLLCLWGALASASFSSYGRQKRGFRGDAASRVAHGFGKRAQDSQISNELSPFPFSTVEDSSSLTQDASEGSLMTVDDFAQLLTSHPRLSRALLKKFVDIDGDGLIAMEELFRPVHRE